MTQDNNTNSADNPTREMPPEHTLIIEVPRELGTYRLTKLLGRGGMGEVWQAFDTSLERDVAIKLMRQELHTNEDATRRFAREARAVARLNHPNIVQVYAFGDEKRLNYFVMEMVEGETVAQCLKRKKQIPLEDALHIMMQAIEGLSYANARGIIHRDIKPSNLMLTEDSRVKIADFGLAKMVEHDTQMTAAGTAMGSPNYMSPEQARGEEADHRSDIYALGVSLYQMLCGDLPFTANSPISVLLKQIQQPLPEHELIKCLNNGEVLHVIKKMTAKAPGDRYQTYGELANALAAIQPNLKFKGAHLPTSSMPAAGAAPIGTSSELERSADLSPVNGGPPPPPFTMTPGQSNSSAPTAPAVESEIPTVPQKTPSTPTPTISSRDSTSDVVPFTTEPDHTRRGLLIATIATIALAAIALVAWLAFRNREETNAPVQTEIAASSTPAPISPSEPVSPPPSAVNPAATPQSAAAAPSPSPVATSAPSTPAAAGNPGVSPTPGSSTTIITASPAAGMQPVDVTALVTPRITPFPGVASTVTPTPSLAQLMPKSIQTPSPAASPAPQIYIIGVKGDTSTNPIPTYLDDTGRNIYKRLSPGTEVTLINQGPTMIRVLPPNESRPVYVYNKMAYPKP